MILPCSSICSTIFLMIRGIFDCITGCWVSVDEESSRGSSDVGSCVRGTPKVKVLPVKQKNETLFLF